MPFESLDQIINDVIRVEGGFTVDHAGPTNYGITTMKSSRSITECYSQMKLTMRCLTASSGR